jgi:hypothetical protein
MTVPHRVSGKLGSNRRVDWVVALAVRTDAGHLLRATLVSQQLSNIMMRAEPQLLS